jgi:dihydrofolate reductase
MATDAEERDMSRVLWNATMSLDGLIAGPGDDMTWIFDSWGRDPNPTANKVIEETGAILMGRRTYEVEDRNRPGIYGGAWAGPFFVLTHDPPADPPDWMTGEFIDEGIEAAVARAAEAADGKAIGLLGAGIARQCIDAGLLDEIVVHVAPVLLGDGVRLFDVAGGRRVDLERTELDSTGQLTDLWFRVRR